MVLLLNLSIILTVNYKLHKLSYNKHKCILTFSFRALNGAWPSIISNTKQPKLNQSVLYVYFSLSITSGAVR